MTDGVSFELNGMSEVLARLEGLQHEVKYKGGRFALRKAAQLVKQSAVANALQINDPKTAEEIAKNITLRWSSRRFKSTGDLMFRVGVLGGARATGKEAEKGARKHRRQGITSLDELGEIEGKGKQNPGGDTYYWRFVEFGTSRAPANPFLRRALADNVGAAVNEFVKHFEPAIDRALKRAAKE